MAKDALDNLFEDDLEGWEDEVKSMQKQAIGNEEEPDDKGSQKDLIPEDADDLEEEEVVEEDEEVIEEDDPLDDLKAEIEQLNKERRGLFKELKGERRIRQEMGGQLNALNSTITQIVQQRQAAQTVAPEVNDPGITVEFDDEGGAVIPTEAILKALGPLEEQIKSLNQKVQTTDALTQQSEKAQALVGEILSEDERFVDAHLVYRRARNWVEQQVIDFQTTNNLAGTMSSGEALDYVFDQGLVDEFSERFPNADLEDVVIAEDSPSGRFFRKALNNIAEASTPDEPARKEQEEQEHQEKFKKVLKKPNGLGSSADQRSKGKSVLDIAENLSSLDALELSDGQVDSLLKALEREEKTGGIQFN